MTLSAYHLYGKPAIPVRIQMEQFILVEIFQEEGNIFRGVAFFPLCRNDRNFLYHFCGLPVPGFLSRESDKFTGIL